MSVAAYVRLLRRAVVGVGPYVPGVSAAEVKGRYGRSDMVRLNWNENLFGPLPGVAEETAAALEARERLVGAAAGVAALPSDANFVLLELSADDLRVAETLAQREGVLVRPGLEFGLPGYIRVTTGAEELMEIVGAQIVGAQIAGHPAMSRVVLLDPGGELDTIADVLRAYPDVAVERAEALPSGDDVVGVLVPPEIPVGPRQLAAMPGVRIVAATATGFDHLDMEAIAAAGAWATHWPGYCDEEVAEHAVTFSLALLRGIVLLDRSARAGIWDQTPSPPRRVEGATLGIVGLGRIGRAVARRATALGMRVLAYDP